MTRITNVRISNITDHRGYADPLSGWRLNSGSDGDVRGYFADANQVIYVDSKEQGLVRKDLYMQKHDLYFELSGNL